MVKELHNLKNIRVANTTSFLHINARSMENKQDDLETLYSSIGVSFDAIMISETWYTEHSNPFDLPDYKTFVLSRRNRRGGGLLLLVRNIHNMNIVHQFSVSVADYEILTVRDSSKIFSVVYRPPSANFHTFLDFLETLFEFASLNKYSLFIGGDFNIDMLKITQQRTELLSLLESYAFKNIINEATRITLHSVSLIDLFIVPADKHILESGCLSSDISDHLPIFAFIRDKSNHPPQAILPTRFQNITERSLNNFRNEIENHDWNEVLSKPDANSMYDAFIFDMVNIYNKHFPCTLPGKHKKSRKPWITNHLLKEIKTKNRLYWEFIRTRDTTKLRSYKSYRNKLNTKLKIAKEEYFAAYFGDAAFNSNLLWKRINSVFRQNAQSDVSSVSLNNRQVSGAELSDLLNTHFTSVGSSADRQNSGSVSLHRTNHFTESMVFFPTTEAEVINTFESLRNSKSRDVNDIQIGPIKYVIDLIAPVLTVMYNLVLESGCFPKQMQIAKVVAIYKGGDKNDLNNFRPISILPVLSKGIEKIMHKRLYAFLMKHSLIAPAQYGFLKGKSTELALLTQKEYLINQLEDKNIVLGLYVDFSKAFDCINHTILLSKLEQYGVRGNANALLCSYLQHRFQFVSHCCANSKLRCITCGVPQGSILGPLLFT